MWHEPDSRDITPVPLTDWLQQNLSATRLVLAPNKRQQNVLTDAQTDLALLIGPEGGLSEAEIDMANHAGFKTGALENAYYVLKQRL